LESLPDEYYARIKKIVMEYHIFNNNFDSYQKMKERLENLKFEITEMCSSNELGMLYAIQKN
jgi:hypothetical protein